MAKARRLIRNAAPYQLIASQLDKQGKDGVMRKCIREDEFILILDEAHSRIVGGHFTTETTAWKVLQAGLWWPTLFSDAVEFVKRCDPYQRATKPQNWDRMPLSMCEDNGREGRSLTCSFLTHTMGEYTQRWRLKNSFPLLSCESQKNTRTKK